MIPVHHYLTLAAMLFGVGVLGVVLRRNALIVLMSIELMLNGANLTMLAFARDRHDVAGHSFAFFIIAVAAAEAAVGLAILVGIFRTRRNVNIDELSLMKQ